MINYKDLKKKDEVRTTQLGTPITGKLLRVSEAGARAEAYHPDL